MSSETESEPGELLSALLDGELAGPELDHLLKLLDDSPGARDRWRRFCAVRAAQEGIGLRLQRDICAGVMSALEGAPAPSQDDRVVPLPVRSRDAPHQAARRGRSQVWSAAAAASVAAVAVIGAVRLHVPAAALVAAGPGALALQSQSSSVTAVPVAAVVPAVPAAVATDADDADPDADRLDPDARRQVDDFVIEHANYRTGGMGGSFGYARVAAHTAELQPADGQP